MIRIHLGGGYGRPHQIFRPWCLQVLFLLAVCERVVEVGCGLGFVGLAAAMTQGSRVIFCDETL